MAPCLVLDGHFAIAPVTSDSQETPKQMRNTRAPQRRTPAFDGNSQALEMFDERGSASAVTHTAPIQETAAMKKTLRKDQLDARLRSPLREVRLQALLFGAAAAAPDVGVLSSSLAISHDYVKLPQYTGE